MRVGQLADPGVQQPPAENPSAQCGRLGGEHGYVEVIFADAALVHARGKCVQRLGVFAQLRGCTGKRRGDTARQHVLQQWQDFGAQPDAREPRVGVVRVLPRFDSEFRARLKRLRAGDAEQWTTPRRIVRTHAGERPWSRPSSETEQHSLGLIVEGMAEKYEPFASRQRFAERVVPRSARGCFRTTFARYVDSVYLSDVNAEALHHCLCFGGDGSGAGL